MEVRTIYGATNPEGDAWLVIERERGLFAIEANVGGASTFRSRGIDSPELAIKASAVWADLLSIQRLYVREGAGWPPQAAK
jgi:hypothetical protein